MVGCIAVRRIGELGLVARCGIQRVSGGLVFRGLGPRFAELNDHRILRTMIRDRQKLSPVPTIAAPSWHRLAWQYYRPYENFTLAQSMHDRNLKNQKGVNSEHYINTIKRSTYPSNRSNN
jgi:hypothetical protein